MPIKSGTCMFDNKPLIIQHRFPDEVKTQLCNLEECKEFHSQCSTSVAFKNTGRVPKQIVTRHAPAKQFLEKIRHGSASKLLAQLSPAEKLHIEQPWWFKYGSTMRACGAEFSYLGSLKATFEGHRAIVVADYGELEDWVKSTLPTGTQPTYEIVRDAFSEVRRLILIRNLCLCR